MDSLFSFEKGQIYEKRAIFLRPDFFDNKAGWLKKDGSEVDFSSIYLFLICALRLSGDLGFFRTPFSLL
jgi:hypothetical protein